jgi:thiol:disulfide interchange protein DsbC
MRLLVLLCVLAVASFSARADEAAIRQNLTARYPDISVKSVTPSPIAGIYEVFANGQLLYTDDKADYILLGPLIDTRNRRNLSHQRLAELNRVDFASLPLDKAIQIKHGNGERKLALFSDPDCPFCKKLEKELVHLDNATIYVFPFPLTELHPQAMAHAKAIWCSADRARSWEDYLLEGKLPTPSPTAAPDCGNPVQDFVELGRKLGISGTPALIFPDGRLVPGAMPVTEIERLLQAPAGG